MSMFTPSVMDIEMHLGISPSPMHQPVEAVEAPVVHSKSETTNPVGSFDSIILKASEGDMLRSMDNADGFYTIGNDFEVIVGNETFSLNMLTIRDDDGLEVPRSELLPSRVTLYSQFMLIPKVDDRVVTLNNLRTKRDEMNADAQSIVDDIKELDAFDAEWNTPFGLMSDVDKGALLLASSEGKEIQGYMLERFDDLVWHKTDFDKPLWNPRAYYRVKPLSYQLLNEMLNDLYAEITTIEAEIFRLEMDIDSDW